MQGILRAVMVTQPVISLRYRVGRSPEAWLIPEVPVPESTAHDAALHRIFSLLTAWATRSGNGARITRNLAVHWLKEHPKTGLDPDVAVLLPAPQDFDELTSYKLWEPGRSPPPLAIEVVSGSHPYKDYSMVHEGYAAMGVQELLVFDPQLFGPKAMGGPVAMQLWRRDLAGGFERIHFGNDAVYSTVLDAWFSVDARQLIIADDRAALQRWPTTDEVAVARALVAEADAERAKCEAERAMAEAERATVEAERRKQEADRERAHREDLERRLAALEANQRGE